MRRKGLFWTLTQKQIKDISNPLDKIKADYSHEVGQFIKTLPKQHHQLAFYLALGVGFELSMELSRLAYDISNKEV